MKIFYISDLHLCHKNIIKLCNRPYSSVEEMNEDIVKNWNSIVSQDDEVRILGDVGFPKNNEDVINIISLVKRLNGKKRLVSGNHDFRLLKNEKFKSLFVEISDYMRVKDGGRDVVLSHYPMEEWDGFYRDFIHLYGHVHNNDVGLKCIKNRYNVGLEVLGYIPRTLDEIIDMNKADDLSDKNGVESKSEYTLIEEYYDTFAKEIDNVFIKKIRGILDDIQFKNLLEFVSECISKKSECFDYEVLPSGKTFVKIDCGYDCEGANIYIREVEQREPVVGILSRRYKYDSLIGLKIVDHVAHNYLDIFYDENKGEYIFLNNVFDTHEVLILTKENELIKDGYDTYENYEYIMSRLAFIGDSLYSFER